MTIIPAQKGFYVMRIYVEHPPERCELYPVIAWRVDETKAGESGRHDNGENWSHFPYGTPVVPCHDLERYDDLYITKLIQIDDDGGVVCVDRGTTYASLPALLSTLQGQAEQMMANYRRKEERREAAARAKDSKAPGETH